MTTKVPYQDHTWDQVCDELQNWVKVLQHATNDNVGQIRDIIEHQKTVQNATVGQTAELCLRGIHKKMIEVQAAYEGLEHKLLSGEVDN